MYAEVTYIDAHNGGEKITKLMKDVNSINEVIRKFRIDSPHFDIVKIELNREDGTVVDIFNNRRYNV